MKTLGESPGPAVTLPESMKCERCGGTTDVQRHEVDGFTGHLCAECRAVWDRLLIDS